MAGKGSAPRPLPDYDKYSDNWDSIFNKKQDYTIRVRKLDDNEDFAYEASVEEIPDLIVYEESYKEAYEVIVDLIRVTEEALAERE